MIHASSIIRMPGNKVRAFFRTMILVCLVMSAGVSCGDKNVTTTDTIISDKVPVDSSRAITVYVTDTGEKYHLEGCRHLKQSKNALALEEAIKKGYDACKVCDPPKDAH